MAKTPDNGKPNRRQAAKQASREALIEAAMDLFPSAGLDVSLDDLCAHAGYTRGAFYVHFKNRDELLLEVMTRVGQQMMDTLLGTRDQDSPEDLAGVATRFIPALYNGDYPLTRHGGMRPYQLLDACARSEAIHQRYLALAQESIERLAQNVRASQAKRWVVYEALRKGGYYPWDYQPLRDASERFMRNHMDLNVLEESQRFPRGE